MVLADRLELREHLRPHVELGIGRLFVVFKRGELHEEKRQLRAIPSRPPALDHLGQNQTKLGTATGIHLPLVVKSTTYRIGSQRFDGPIIDLPAQVRENFVAGQFFECWNGFQSLSIGPCLSGRNEGQINNPNRNGSSKVVVEGLRKEKTHRRDARSRSDPRNIFEICRRCLGGLRIGGNKPEIRVVFKARAGLLAPIRISQAHHHVRLTHSDPYLADQNVCDFHGLRARADLDFVRPTCW